MSEVLYRKYRSQTFDELVGQEHITQILKKSVVSGQLSHAYLFVGSRGTGKTSTARILAKALNCMDLRPDGNPCGECERCLSIAKGTFLDLIEIDAASNRGIDQIRELKERIEYSPNEAKYKIYIIDEVHMLTTEAFNALLKTLEEPPAHVIFMLATTDVHKLPATILSRCQRYDFRLGTDLQIESLVQNAAEKEGVNLSTEALKVLVQNANGSYRDALSLLDVVVSSQLGSDEPSEVSGDEVRRFLGIPDSTMVYYLLEKLSEGDPKSALGLVRELDQKGVDLQQFVKYILVVLREILISKMTGSDSEYTFADSLSPHDVIRYVNLFLDAEKKLRSSAIPSLVIELVIAEVALAEAGELKKSSPKVVSGSKSPQVENKVTAKDLKPEKLAKSEKADRDATIATESKGKEADKGDNLKESKRQDPSLSTQETVSGSEKEPSDKSDTEEPIKDNVATRKTSAEKLSVDMIQDSWAEITQRVQKFNGHLYAFLKAAKVSAIDSGHLILEVPFEFHKERIETMKSRDAINDIFREIFGVTLPIRCDVNETIQRKKSSTADIILQKAPRSEESKPQATPEQPPSQDKYAAKASFPRKTSKRVEALFADL